MKKYVDSKWDFRHADTKEYTHCFHNYPAMMIPQIARELIKLYGSKASVLFDPYCGTGTSLVEANLAGIEGIGTDLNPLARLISRAKTNEINITKLKDQIADYNNMMFSYSMALWEPEQNIDTEFENMNYWFDPKVIISLEVIKKYIESIIDPEINDFFKTVFSETVRESSWTRNSEFKLYRMSEKQLEKFNPDVFGLMEGKLTRNYEGIVKYHQSKKKAAASQIYDFNTINPIPEDIIQPESIDLIVTSPPYGDSQTTVAYGQFSRLSNQWLGVDDANQVDKKLMGGVRPKEAKQFYIPILDEVIDKIKNKDSKRALDVTSFYIDYKRSINNVASVVKPGGYVCYVVGNRRVKEEVIETDEITKKMFKINGFRHIETIIRSIPNKRMPSRNSPTNEVGKTSSTMTNEYIVVLRKE